MSEFYVEFEVASDEAYRRLDEVVAALTAAKRGQDVLPNNYWLAFFDDAALSRFWWPTESEVQEWLNRWEAAPADRRRSDPSLQPPAWDLDSMIDAILNGDYDLLGCRRRSPHIGRFEFDPFGYPFGGTDCMKALIEAFGHRVIAGAEAY